jgi:hypothetical protein
VAVVRSLAPLAAAGTPSTPPLPPAAGLPEPPLSSSTLDELHGLLDSRLEEARTRAEQWRRVLEADADWRREASVLRAALARQLRPWPGERTDLAVRAAPWFALEGVEATVVSMRTHRNLSLLCALLRPVESTAPGPAILALHGFGGDLQRVVADVDYHHGFAMQLARAGFVVLAPLRVTASASEQSELQTKARVAGWNLEAIDLWQLVRAVDYLESLAGVDRDRIAVYGISWGGRHALRLGALDPRISLVVTSGDFTDRFARLFNPLLARPRTFRPAMHIQYDLPSHLLLDDLNLVAMLLPRYFGVEIGTRDPRHAGAERVFSDVEALYKKAGHPERAAFLAFEGGHEISLANTLPFLRRWERSPPLPLGERGAEDREER